MTRKLSFLEAIKWYLGLQRPIFQSEKLSEEEIVVVDLEPRRVNEDYADLVIPELHKADVIPNNELRHWATLSQNPMSGIVSRSDIDDALSQPEAQDHFLRPSRDPLSSVDAGLSLYHPKHDSDLGVTSRSQTPEKKTDINASKAVSERPFTEDFDTQGNPPMNPNDSDEAEND